MKKLFFLAAIMMMAVSANAFNLAPLIKDSPKHK